MLSFELGLKIAAVGLWLRISYFTNHMGSEAAPFSRPDFEIILKGGLTDNAMSHII